MICTVVTDYKDLLLECFSTDLELLNTWHIEAGSGLENCVNRTYTDLQKYNVTVYKLEIDDKLVGYFGVEPGDFLSGFFIKPEYRNKETIKSFWKLVDSKFNDKYFAALFKKNERAINFLSKHGEILTEVETPYGIGILFMISKGL